MMHQHPCVDVRDRLEAFYDGELPVEERVAIQNHLGECVACSLAAEELGTLGASLRELAAQTADGVPDEPLRRMSTRVLERVGVEEQFSLRSQMRGLFQDMHLVWAGLGATAAMLICVIGSASVLHAANQQQPGSFANTISILANPGSNENPLRLDYEMLVPPKDDTRPLGVMASPIVMREEEAEYALSAVVSREGRVQGVELINQAGVKHRSVNAMLNEAYRVQFAPAEARGGDAVAVSMVWLVSNTTVKGRHAEDIDALRNKVRAQTTPQPIGPLPLPADLAAPKPASTSLVKPIVPDVMMAAALAAGL